MNVSSANVSSVHASKVSPVRVAQRQVFGIVVLMAGLCVAGFALTAAPLGALERWDESLSRRLTGNRSVEATEFAQFVSQAGDTRPILVLMGVITLLVALGRQWRPVVFVPLAMLAEIGTFLAVNYIVGRPRPEVDTIGPIPSTFSFPSGHVAATLVCWTGAALLLCMYRHRLLAPLVMGIAVFVTAAMAWARVYLGMHHVLDVIAGLLMGIGVLGITVWALGIRRAITHPGIIAETADTGPPAATESRTAVLDAMERSRRPAA